MRFEDYDIINSVYDHVEEFRARHKLDPRVLIISPAAYQWLRSLQECDTFGGPDRMPEIGDWSFSIADLRLRIEIDEMADDFSIRLR